jgi:hypothetical protein
MESGIRAGFLVGAESTHENCYCKSPKVEFQAVGTRSICVETRMEQCGSHIP